MNKFVMMLVALMVTLFGVNAFAFTPPDAPAKGWYVVDKAGKLSQSDINRLNQKIETVSKTTKNEFGILVLDTMDGGNIEDAAYDTFKKWGVGKHGLDNGVLIVISVKERKSRIETGKGVGGEVPDLKAKEILDKNLAPHLKRGDFYGGLDETLSALSSLIESRHNEKVTPRPAPVAAPTYTPASSPATTSNPAGVTPPSSGPRTNNGGCSMAAPGASAGDSSFNVAIFGLGLIFLGGWLMARRSKKKREAAEAKAREEHARQVRILAQRKLQEELEAAAKERDRILNLPTPAVAVPAVRAATPTVPPTPSYRPYIPSPPPPPPAPIRRVVAPLPIPVPRPVPKVETKTTPVVTAPTTVVATGEALAAAAAATALRRKQEEAAAEERRIREAGEENRRRQARREAEAEEERQAEARREARRQEERYEEERREARRREEREEEERRAQARRDQEEHDRQRREEESRSSYSSYDSGSSSYDSGGSSDSGGGFGGGDSGGGGASSDW